MNSNERSYSMLGRFTSLYFVVVLAFSFVILTVPTINPEFAYFWQLNESVKNINDLTLKYFEYFGGWYRPTSIYAYHWIIASIAGWHNIFAFQLVTVSLFFINAFVLTKLAELVYGFNRTECYIGFLLITTNLVGYIVLYEANGFDYIYQISSTFFLINCYKLINIKENEETANGLLYGILALISFVIAITSKEQTIILIGILLYMVAFPVRKRSPTHKFSLIINALLALVISLSLLWMYFVAFQVAQRSGGYRTNLDLTIFWQNILHFLSWSLRFNFFTIHDYLDYHNSLLFNINSAFILLALIVATLKSNLTLGKFWRSNNLLIIIALFSAVFPAFFGGSPWHFIFPINVVSLILAHYLGSFFDKNISSLIMKNILLTTGTISLIASSLICIILERDYARSFFVRIVPSSIEIASKIGRAPVVVDYSTGVYGDNLWPWSRGIIFNYSFLDGDIKVNAPIVESQCQKNISPDTVCVTINKLNNGLSIR